MRSIILYPRVAVERAMKVLEVILRAMAKKITWWVLGGTRKPSFSRRGRVRERT